MQESLDSVPNHIRERSGGVFYSGRSAFRAPSSIYLLGLNPAGNPGDPPNGTVGSHIVAAMSRHEDAWSEYADEVWKIGYGLGQMPHQKRVLHLADRLGLSIREVPASNVIFVRTANEAQLEAEKKSLLRDCWPVHEAVISRLGITTIVCFGKTAGAWVREQVGADLRIGEFTEANDRKWQSLAHKNAAGIKVVTVTHPSVADWLSPAADVSSFVRDVVLANDTEA